MQRGVGADVGIAGLVLFFLGIRRRSSGRARPSPVARQKVPSIVVVLRAKVMSRGRHVRRHHRDEIVRADQPVERVDERLADVVRAVDVDVVGVEEEHEHARARVLRGIARDSATVFGSRRTSCGPLPRITHALELLDLLRRAAFEDLEVVLREVGDRRAVLASG